MITTNLTYTRDVSRVFAHHCLSCHDAHSSIPLTTYEQVRPWAVSIKEQVLRRSMPPWGAVKGFGELAPDYGLSQEDILIIAAWVVGGAPQGSVALSANSAPAQPAAPAPALRDALVIDTQGRLTKAIAAAGVRPITASIISSARLIAKYPDGRIQPLLWLNQYDPKFARSFSFRRPLELPPGTVVESSAPLKFALECKARSAAQN